MLKELSIEIIRKCPNYCVHCSSLSDIACTEVLPIEEFVGIVNDAHKLGAKTICLSGGEPFLHPQVIKMITCVADKNLDCYVYSSGITTDKNNTFLPISIDILSAIASKVTKIIFNIEAATESTYNRIMGTTGCLGLLKESIISANDLNIITEAHFVPMKLNLDEIGNVIALCQELGVSKLSFLRLVLHGRAKHNETLLALNEEELASLRNRLKELSLEKELDIRIGVPLSNDSDCHKCEAANGKINIKYDGGVFPCEVFKNNCADVRSSRFEPDNVYRRSFFDIYKNSQYLNFVRSYSQAFSCNSNFETCIGQHLISNNI
ncbi:MAG: radical SAM protein [Eggerthellaceae bacterium]|nr:radical SAM protein [Eggerthellaceae bacterium]